MNIKEAAQLFLEKHKTFKEDSLDIGKDPLENAVEHLRDEGQRDPHLVSADTYLEIGGYESVSGNPEIIDWYEYGKPETFEMRTTSVWGGEYKYETEIFDDYDSALEAAKPYLLHPVRLNEFQDFEDSVILCSKESGEDIDLYFELDLDKESIFKSALEEAEWGSS